MCAIVGEVNIKEDAEWIDSQIDLALKRGKDLTHYATQEISLYHTRLATNNSPDTYPIILDNAIFAMNGIVGAKTYKELVAKYGKVNEYTVDSAFFLKLYLDNRDWKLFDTDNFVFAFWLIEGDKLFLGNKDFPLFILREKGGLRFSSFKNEGFEPLGNKVIEYDLKTKEYIEHLTFEDLVYG